MAQYSGHYLFGLFNDEDKQRFKFNYENSEAEFEEMYSSVPRSFEKFLDEVYPSINDFMFCSFIWGLTPEGFEFWSNLCDNLNTSLK